MVRRLVVASILSALASPTFAQYQLGAWGSDNFGESTLPLGIEGIIAVAAGANHNMALLSSGNVICWGDDSSGQATTPLGVGSVVTKIAAGRRNSVALKRDGTVTVWGDNTFGQLTPPVGATNIVAISAGSDTILALRANGDVLSWGQMSQATVPAGATNIKAIAAGFAFNLALTEEGTVVAWGTNSFGQATVPAGLSDVVAIAAGGSHSLALKSNGTVVGWGNNGFGQMTGLDGFTGIKAVAASARNSYLVSSSGQIFILGDNERGQALPPRAMGRIESVSANNLHALALSAAIPRVNLSGTILSGDTQRVRISLPKTAQGIGTVTLESEPVGLLTVPATVAVESRSTVADFVVSASDVANAGTAVIRAHFDERTPTGLGMQRRTTQLAEINLTVRPSSLARLEAIDPEVFGGTSATCRVVLNGTGAPAGTVVALSSLDPAVFTVPATVQVNAGDRSANFAAAAAAVDSSSIGTVRAQHNGLSRTATITVKPAAPRDIALASPAVVGGNNLSGNVVKLRGVAGLGGVALSLGTSNPAVASVPSTVTVQPGGSQVSFKITTLAVASQEKVTIFATGNGVAVSQTLTVDP